MNYSDLQKQLIKDDLVNVYLFEGEEEYLRDHCTTTLKDKVINDDSFDIHRIGGKDCADKINDIIDSSPLFNSSKFLIVQDSELFKTGNGSIAFLLEKIKDIDKNTYIVFQEQKTDKRSSLYKSIKRYGRIYDCELQKEADLINWVRKSFKRDGYMLDQKTARKFIDISDRKMNSIKNEMKKIEAFKGDDKIIKDEDVELLTTKNITNNVFDLIDAIAKRNKNEAIDILNEMIYLKVPEQMILFLISNNFIDMLKAVQLKKKSKNNQEIASEIGIRYEWLVRKLLDFSKKFSFLELRTIITYCTKADENIKKGLYPARLSLEVLISEIVK